MGYLPGTVDRKGSTQKKAIGIIGSENTLLQMAQAQSGIMTEEARPDEYYEGKIKGFVRGFEREILVKKSDSSSRKDDFDRSMPS